MIKNKLINKIIAVSLTALTLTSSAVPAMAATDNVNSIASVAEDVSNSQKVGQDKNRAKQTKYSEYQDDTNTSTDVYVSQTSTFSVTAPVVAILNGQPDENNNYSGDVKYSIKGNIASNEIVKVVPDDSLSLSQSGKNDIECSIVGKNNEVAKTEFTYADGLRAEKELSQEYTITTEDITAGSWHGNFNTNISLEATPLGVVDDDYRAIAEANGIEIPEDYTNYLVYTKNTDKPDAIYAVFSQKPVFLNSDLAIFSNTKNNKALIVKYSYKNPYKEPSILVNTQINTTWEGYTTYGTLNPYDGSQYKWGNSEMNTNNVEMKCYFSNYKFDNNGDIFTGKIVPDDPGVKNVNYQTIATENDISIPEEYKYYVVYTPKEENPKFVYALFSKKPVYVTEDLLLYSETKNDNDFYLIKYPYKNVKTYAALVKKSSINSSNIYELWGKTNPYDGTQNSYTYGYSATTNKVELQCFYSNYDFNNNGTTFTSNPYTE